MTKETVKKNVVNGQVISKVIETENYQITMNTEDKVIHCTVVQDGKTNVFRDVSFRAAEKAARLLLPKEEKKPSETFNKVKGFFTPKKKDSATVMAELKGLVSEFTK